MLSTGRIGLAMLLGVLASPAGAQVANLPVETGQPVVGEVSNLSVETGQVASGPRKSAGVVFVLGGIGGLDPVQLWAPVAIWCADLPHEVRVFEWTHGKCRLLRDLQDTRYLCAQGARLAAEVLAIKSREPARPIYLVGHSAGAGVILAATEHLPPATIERIVLLSAAVSPGCDLTAALRATRCEVVSFHSKFDRLTLGVGTSLFGTVDRIYCVSAGAEGFVLPDGLDAEGRKLYERLVQVPWTMRWFFESFYGGPHHGTCMPVFLARRVVPWLMP
jgi:pimeloyl-ACP methyl ester carboxylesterase